MGSLKQDIMYVGMAAAVDFIRISFPAGESRFDIHPWIRPVTL